MKAQQIIYTSCRRGIDGGSSGFQNYSYSPQTKEWLDAGDAIGTLQSYQPPRLPGLPALPTVQEAQTLFPRRECFGRLDGPDGLYGMAMCSYIGRDYPEGSVRGGNFLSHALLVPVESITDYPCVFIDSPSFVTWIDENRVRSDARPDYLPAVNVEKNAEISLESVRSFLSEGDNAELFALMLRCLLVRSKNGAVRSIIIRDSAENFAMWVSALEYALPVKQALDWGFSFYEYAPSQSSADVIRAVDGMAETLDAFPYDFVFDPDNGVMPGLEGEDDDETIASFAEFVATAMQYSPDSMRVFHDYLGRTSYTASGRGIASAYLACQLDSGAMTLADCDETGIKDCGRFLSNYGTADQRRVLFDTCLSTLREDELPDETRGAIVECVAELIAGDDKLQGYAFQEVRDILAALVTTRGVSEVLYRQVHDVAEVLPKAAAASLDSAVFAEVTANPGLSLDATTSGSGVPWQVSEYAALASSVIAAEVARGVNLPAGASGEQMLAAFSPQSSAAVRKLTDAIVAASLASTGMDVASQIGRQWGGDSSLALMLDLLILQHPSASPELREYVIRQIADMLFSGDDRRKTEILQSLVASGLSEDAFRFLLEMGNRSENDVVDFVHLLAAVLPALPAGFGAAYGQALVDRCWQGCVSSLPWAQSVAVFEQLAKMPAVSPQWRIDALAGLTSGIPIVNVEKARDEIDRLDRLYGMLSVPVPGRFLLAAQQLTIHSIGVLWSKSDALRARQWTETATRQGGTLPMQVLQEAEQHRYVQEMASSLAEYVTADGMFLRLQLHALPMPFTGALTRFVLNDVIRTGNIDTAMLLVLVDYLLICHPEEIGYPEARGLGIDEMSFVNGVTRCLIDAGVKSSVLEKYVPSDDGKQSRQCKRLAEIFVKYMGRNLPNQELKMLMIRILPGISQHDQANRGFFGSLARRFGRK